MRTRRWYKGPTLSNQPLYSPQSSFHTTALLATACDRFFPRQFSRREPFRSPLLHLSHSLFLLPISLSPLWILDQQAAYKAKHYNNLHYNESDRMKKKREERYIQIPARNPHRWHTNRVSAGTSQLSPGVCVSSGERRRGKSHFTVYNWPKVSLPLCHSSGPQAGRGTARSNSAFK